MSDFKIGSNSGNPLMSLLDPAGLMGGLQSLFGGSGESAGIGKLGQSMLGMIGQGMNLFGAHGDDASAAGASEPAKTPGTTEMSSVIDSSKIQGYADSLTKSSSLSTAGQSDDSSLSSLLTQSEPSPSSIAQQQSQSSSIADESSDAQTQSQAQTQAITSDETRQTSSAASTAATDAPGLSSKDMTTLMAVTGNFDDFDAQGAQLTDGVFDRGNLNNIVNDPYFNAYPDIQNAARALLDNPELYNKLAVLSGGHGEISREALAQFLQAEMTANAGGLSAASTPAATPGTQQVGSKSGGIGTIDVTQSGSSSSTAQPKAATVSAPAATAADQDWTAVGQANQKEARSHISQTSSGGQSTVGIQMLGADVDAAMKTLNDAEKAGAPQSKLDELTRNVQTKMQAYERMNTLFSDMMKAFHETMMNTIRNVK